MWNGFLSYFFSCDSNSRQSNFSFVNSEHVLNILYRNRSANAEMTFMQSEHRNTHNLPDVISVFFLSSLSKQRKQNFGRQFVCAITTILNWNKAIIANSTMFVIVLLLCTAAAAAPAILFNWCAILVSIMLLFRFFIFECENLKLVLLGRLSICVIYSVI